MYDAIAILVVIIASIYVIRKLYIASRRTPECGCGCSSCNTRPQCDESRHSSINSEKCKTEQNHHCHK